MREKRNQRTILIVSLLVIIFIMVVGFAAFATNLTINGTANISTSWNVQITNIRGVNDKLVTNNGAYEVTEPTITDNNLTANFHTGLISPGDKRIYEVEVTNLGSVDAEVTSVFNKPINDAIIFTYDGVSETSVLQNDGTYDTTNLSKVEPFELLANTNNKKYLYITVTYNPNVTGQPSSLEASITLTLTAVQKGTATETTETGKVVQTLSKYGVSIPVVSEGDGLYNNGDGTYTYKGANPNNYIKLGTDTYRIMEIDKDGNLKVIRENTISLQWDPGYSTSISGITNSSSIKGTRYAGLSSNTTDYCVSANTKEKNYYGCKAWGSKYSTLDRNGNSILDQNTQIAQMPWEAGSTTLRNLPEYDSYINAYLNGEYYPCDASISGCENGKKKLTAWYETNVASTLQSKIVDHLWNIGPIKSNNSDLATDISQAEAYKWRGKVGLMNVIDYVKASTNPACTNVAKYYNNTANKVCYENSNTHNCLYKSSMQWTMAPYSYSYPRSVWHANSGGSLEHLDANNSFASRPAFYLSSNIQLTGTGESTSNAYTITN